MEPRYPSGMTTPSLPYKIPNGPVEVEAVYGVIRFDDIVEKGKPTGAIRITNDWAAENIVKADLPIVGKRLVHKKAEPAFRTALQAIKDKGLASEIKDFQVWAPRHKMWNVKRPLSTHSWAIACDINPPENPVGRVGKMHPDVVAAFEAAGFEWGGRWKSRDDMHFQLCTGF